MCLLMCACVVDVTNEWMRERVCVFNQKSMHVCLFTALRECFRPAVMHTGVFSPIVCVLRRVFVCICWNVNRFICYLQLYPISTFLFIPVVFRPLHGVPRALHILYVSLYLTPTSGLAGSTNELVSWIRCDRWGRHTGCAGLGVLQDRLENHWFMPMCLIYYILCLKKKKKKP